MFTKDCAKSCSCFLKVTSELTEFPYSTVKNIEKKERTSSKLSRINENLGHEIKNIIYNFYKKRVPATKGLIEKLIKKEYKINYSEYTLRSYLRSVGLWIDVKL